MSELESKTLDQILTVISRSRSKYIAGFPIETSYREAIQEVAASHNVTYQTIVDGCRRRLDLKNINEFSRLLREYFLGNSRELMDVLINHTDISKHLKIKQFFKEGTQTIKLDVAKQPKLPLQTASADAKHEIFSFRLDHENAKKLNALAGLEGSPVPEWLAKTISDVVEQRLKEWAKTFVTK